jgi:hypothetical protein
MMKDINWNDVGVAIIGIVGLVILIWAFHVFMCGLGALSGKGC